MTADHVEASLSCPTLPRFCGQAFYEASDRDVGLACVKAYNDFMIEEWCGDSDGALIPLIIIPLWDADLAAAEAAQVPTTRIGLATGDRLIVKGLLDVPVDDVAACPLYTPDAADDTS